MKVKDLKKLLENVDDEMEVMLCGDHDINRVDYLFSLDSATTNLGNLGDKLLRNAIALIPGGPAIWM